ncbi:MAG: hypothetical protein GX298_11940 [Planctomycetes bacterium]|jgi:hypothetical protein|nr:hypothetical protein [Planctomycetota bacterium]
MNNPKTRRFQLEMRRVTDRQCRVRVGTAEQQLNWASPDFPTERVIRHLDTNPIGRLLKLIAALPEVRYEKIEHARRQLSMSDEVLNERLDVALDRVLEELTTEG